MFPNRIVSGYLLYSCPIFILLNLQLNIASVNHGRGKTRSGKYYQSNNYRGETNHREGDSHKNRNQDSTQASKLSRERKPYKGQDTQPTYERNELHRGAGFVKKNRFSDDDNYNFENRKKYETNFDKDYFDDYLEVDDDYYDDDDEDDDDDSDFLDTILDSQGDQDYYQIII